MFAARLRAPVVILRGGAVGSLANLNKARTQLDNIVGPCSVRCPFSSHGRCMSSQSSFQPPSPNVYRGTPVYPNIDYSIASASAQRRNSDPESVFVVTGASRSMGLEYVKQLLQRTHGRIVACVRNPEQKPDLDAFLRGAPVSKKNRVTVLPLDVTEQDQVVALAEELSNRFGRVDGLFNVAGELGDAKTTPGPERNLLGLDRVWFRQQMEVNAIGPMMVTAALAQLLRAKKGKKFTRSSEAESVVVNMSARVGSIADNTGGLGWHTYRMSKAALNQGTRTSSYELVRQGTWTVAMYPGFTDTDMSVPFQGKGMKEKGLVFPVDFTVGRMLDVVDAMGEENSGGFYDWAGQALPF